MRLRSSAFVLAGIVGAACDPPVVDRPFCATCEDRDHPLNQVMLPAFEEAGQEPRLSGPRELCARLAVDLLGRPMSASEAEATCSGRDLEDVLLEMQGSPEYLIVSERHWADRFQVNDVITHWRYLKDLYTLVDRLHLGEIAYDDFAIEAMAHPGLMVADFEGRARVQRVFRAFMGRPASQSEADGLAGLFRPWLIAFEQDPDFPDLAPYLYFLHAGIIPGLCEPLSRCSTTLYGGATLELSTPNVYDLIPVEDLSARDREALRTPGRLLVAQPTFHEAAADEILNRYLAWDEGNRDIRTPGFLFPELRQALADFLRDTGDYPAAERLVLTSWLYRQTADVTSDGVTVEADEENAPPPFLVGPSKPMNAETWLASVQRVTSFDIGACDNRYGDGFPFFLVNQALGDGAVTLARHNQVIEALHALREDRNRLQSFNGVRFYDFVYTQYARMLGGCPGFQARRQQPAGVSYALLQEGLAEAFCAPGVFDLAVPSGAINVRSVVQHQVPLLLSRPATEADVAAVEGALDCGDRCGNDELVNKTCVAIVGSAEFLFR